MTVTVYANNQTSHRILGVELELIQDTIFIASGGKILLPLMDFKFLNIKIKRYDYKAVFLSTPAYVITTNAWNAGIQKL